MLTVICIWTFLCGVILMVVGLLCRSAARADRLIEAAERMRDRGER